MYSQPLGYLLTWTTFGTHLPGDDRGWVHPAMNEYGTPTGRPDSVLLETCEGVMGGSAYRLGERSRPVVMRAILDHCTHRAWRARAINVRTDHVHMVVSKTDRPPERLLGELKSWATRRLRAAGLAPTDSRLWTREGSTRYLFDEDSVFDSIDYVLFRQGVDLGGVWGGERGSGVA